ncbi:hypothetical protein [Haladaptatus sp. DFWS20]|uniref:hypothetical protein n=1 Tax=Haladaptatus sp. DFWS20 TaxID=3403467 RepID=UPI003EB700DA
MNADAVTPLKGLTTTFSDQAVTVLFGRITPTEWHCFLQFPSQDSVVHFSTESSVSHSRLDQQTDLDLENHHP